jgi:hypothetical protein
MIFRICGRARALNPVLVLFCVFSCGLLNAQSPAQLITPPNGSTGVMPPVAFSWNAVQGATAYYLYVGSAAGLKDVYDSGELLQTNLSRALPAATYYATLWTKIDGHWQSTASTFTVASAAAKLTSPADGNSIASSSILFSWTSVDGAQAYYLYVGTVRGLNDVYNSGETQRIALNRTLSPGTYYARLWTKLDGAWYGNDSSFTVLPSPAVLSTPTNGANAVTSPVNFIWSHVDQATNYYLYVGSAPGLKDVVDSGETTQTSMSRVLSPGKYYATVWTQLSERWVPTSSSFTVVERAVLKTPSDGALEVPTVVTFGWDPVPSAQAYYLYVGTAPGFKDVINSGETLQTSITRELLPETKYYVSLYTKIGGSWLSTTSSFFVGESKAKITWPADGASNVDPMRPITWTRVPNAQAYYLYVGTQPGLKDVYDSGETQLTSISPERITEDGTYFLTLYTKKNERWQPTSISYSTGAGFAKFIQPTENGEIDPETLFSWTEAPGPVDAYQLTIGSSLGAANVFRSSNTASFALRVPGLAYGKTYFARITTKKYGTSRSVDIALRTLKQEDIADLEERKRTLYDKVFNLTRDVRLMADQHNYPVDGTPLAEWVAANNRTQALCNDYASVLQTELQDRLVLARVRNITLNGNGHENHTLAEFYDPFLEHWTATDPTFGYVYWDTNHVGKSVEDLSAALLTDTFASVPLEFVTDYRDQLASSYYMDPVTLFANYFEPGLITRTDNAPDNFLEELSVERIGAAGVYTFKLENTDQTVALNGGSVVLSGANGTLFTQAITLSEGWQLGSTDSVKIYTFKRLRF